MIIFTNGCFDILHAGHLKVLNRCRELARNSHVGLVCIAVNSDASYERLKNRKPINSQETRAGLLSAWADDVIVFEGDTPIDVIRSVRPDIIVKGGDYTIDTVVGHEMAKVEIVPLLEGVSTTNIRRSLSEGCN